MHNGFLNVEGEKMSKSLGNFVTIRDLLDESPGEALASGAADARITASRSTWTSERPGTGQGEALDRFYGALRGSQRSR